MAIGYLRTKYSMPSPAEYIEYDKKLVMCTCSLLNELRQFIDPAATANNDQKIKITIQLQLVLCSQANLQLLLLYSI